MNFVVDIESLDSCLDLLAEKRHIGRDAGLTDGLVVEVDTHSSGDLNEAGDLVSCCLSEEGAVASLIHELRQVVATNRQNEVLG